MKFVRIFNIFLLSVIFGCFSVYGAEVQNEDLIEFKSEALDSKIPEEAWEAANETLYVLDADYDPEQLQVEAPLVLYRSEADDILSYEFPITMNDTIVAISDVSWIESDDEEYEYVGGIEYTEDGGDSFSCYLTAFLNEMDYIHHTEFLISAIIGEENFMAYSPSTVYAVNGYTISESENTEEAYTTMVENIAAAIDEKKSAQDALSSDIEAEAFFEGASGTAEVTETESSMEENQSVVASSEAATESSETAESSADAKNPETVSDKSQIAPFAVGIVIAMAAVGIIVLLRKRR